MPSEYFMHAKTFGFSSAFIAYLTLPHKYELHSYSQIFPKLRGVDAWEVDSPHSAYLLLETWMSPLMIRDLYHALRATYGRHIRFGAALQKTTARAAALYKNVPHCSIIPASQTEAFLSQLPIRLLPGLGERTTKFLESRGVRTFNAFRAVPAQTLKQWFGVSGLILQQFARGLDPRIVESQAARVVSAG